MDKKNYLSIGELAKILGISNQTLIYYDKIGLLAPDWIDPVNGYRYYSKSKIFSLSTVKYLKNAGFSLKEIQDYLKKKNIKDIVHIYQNKIAEIRKEISLLEESENQIKTYIHFFEKMVSSKTLIDSSLIEKMTLKHFPQRKIVFIRKKIKFDYPTLMFLYNQLLTLVFENNLKVNDQVISVFHGGYDHIYHQKTDFEIALELMEPASHKNIRHLPAQEYLSFIHRGKYPSSIQSYEKMKKWIKENDYEINGAIMHFLLVPIASCQDPEETVFEILLPVVKK